MNPVNKGRLYYIFSIIGLFLLWELAGYLPDTLVPTPLAVFEFILEELKNGEIFLHVGATLYRMAISFVVALCLGMVLGLSMGYYKNVNSLFDFWLIFFLNIPALVVILLCYIFLGLTEIAAITAVIINKTPNQAVLFRESARSFEPQYLRLAKVYRFGLLKSFYAVILPQIFPFVIAAARSGLAIIWKIVLVVELLGRSNGVGFKLYYFFNLFYIEGIFAYSIVFICIIQCLEWGVLIPIEKKYTAWRKS